VPVHWDIFSENALNTERSGDFTRERASGVVAPRYFADFVRRL
jgi:hypothetical protein